ncbi:cytochrome c [Pelobacter sp. M08fum]|uniref:Cytochrome c n=2 Tax=Pelovirga terrestris TaxID=2771352 RepID=A0A8J6QLP3_9BACT|nr:cytochrome c [Pelovirga terrestris]
MVACSNDSTETTQSPAPASKPAEDTIQRATDTVQKTADQVVEKGQELKDEAVQYVGKASETVAAKSEELQAGAEKLAQQGSDRLAALVPTAATFDKGRSIYQQSCRSCHDSGIMGAPKIGHERYSADIERLVANSIKGIGRMPARGGNRNLSDEDVRAAVLYMVEESK